MSRLEAIREEKLQYKILGSIGLFGSVGSGYATRRFVEMLPKAREWYQHIEEYSQGPDVQIAPGIEISRRTFLENFATTPQAVELGIIIFGSATALFLALTGYSLYKPFKMRKILTPVQENYLHTFGDQK